MRIVPGDDRPPWWTRPAAGEGWRWAVIGYALDSTGRTVRLCIILLVLCVPSFPLLVILKG